MQLSEYIKLSLMNPLQERVASIGTCPKCHKRTLRLAHRHEDMQFWQCSGDLAVYVLTALRSPEPSGGAE